MGDSAPLEDILDQKVCRIVTKPLENSWMRVSLIAHQIRPTSYTLRHYSSWDTEALRSWKLEVHCPVDKLPCMQCEMGEKLEMVGLFL